MSFPELPALEVKLTPTQHRILDLIADVGLLGSSREEVAGYLIARSLDDLMRQGAISIEDTPAGEGAA